MVERKGGYFETFKKTLTETEQNRTKLIIHRKSIRNICKKTVTKDDYDAVLMPNFSRLCANAAML